jgi:hypothetical protein
LASAAANNVLDASGPSARTATTAIRRSSASFEVSAISSVSRNTPGWRSAAAPASATAARCTAGDWVASARSTSAISASVPRAIGRSSASRSTRSSGSRAARPRASSVRGSPVVAYSTRPASCGAMIVGSVLVQPSRGAPRSRAAMRFQASGATIARVRPVSATISPKPGDDGSQWNADRPGRPARTTTRSPPGPGARSK